MNERTCQAGLITREGEIGNIQPSADGKSLTFDVTWTTGARGTRFDWSRLEEFEEELGVSESEVRLERMRSGRMPVLDSHSSYGVKSVLGVVERGGLADGKGHATLRMSARESVAPIVQDLRDKVLRNVSVGYRVHKYRDVTPKDAPEGTRRIKRAVDWEPWELSLVPIGFDPDAHTRATQETYPCVFEESGMSDHKTTGGEPAGAQRAPDAVPQAPAAAPAPVAQQDVTRGAVEAEMTRQREIRKIVRKAGLGEDLADQLCDRSATVVEAKDLVLEKLSARSEEFRPASGSVTMGADPWDKFRAAMQNALEHRAEIVGDDKLTSEGSELRGYRLLDMVREALRVRKMDTTGSGPELIRRAYGGMQGTSDLPNLFLNVANKSLKRGWLQFPSTYRNIARKENKSDFKQFSVISMGEGGNFLSVVEHGEIKFTKVTDGKEVGKLATAGRGYTFTREAIINDDLSGLSRVPQMAGAAAARWENAVAWALITGNVTLGDGIALFHSSHANLDSTAALSETTLGTSRKLMRLQKGPDSNATLNIMPRFLIVPAALEVTAEKLTTQIFPAESGKVNFFVNKFEPFVEPLLDAASATAFYLAADPNAQDILQYGYLEGAEGPQTESETDLTTLGVKMVAYLDFYCMVLDFRGLTKNAGA